MYVLAAQFVVGYFVAIFIGHVFGGKMDEDED